MTLNQRITAARNHLARAASYIAESLGTDSLHDTERWNEDDDPITTDYELRATNPKGHSE